MPGQKSSGGKGVVKALTSRFVRCMAVLILASSLLAVTPAKHGGRSTPSSNTGAQRSSSLQRSIPVFWQTTRSRFLSSGPSTQTESYHETWRMEPRDAKSAWLISPRGKAIVSGADLFNSASKVPNALVISERDLARLIGLTPEAPEAEEVVEDSHPHRILLTSGSKGNQALTLKISDDERYSVQFEMGQASTF